MSANLTSDQNVMDKLAGGKYYPYKLCIIGGGPAGQSILVRAMRLGLFNEICRGSDQEAGVCLLDGGSMERLGGGRLQDYIINSNTWADKFYTNVIEDKPNNIPPETIVGTKLEELATLKGSAAGQKLLAVGEKEASLQTVGSFLVDVGSAVRIALLEYPSSSFLMTNTLVTNVQRALVVPQASETVSKSSAPQQEENMGSDEAKIDVLNKATSVPLSFAQPKALWKVSAYCKLTNQKRDFYCTNCVLATGGLQSLPDLKSKSFNDKLITSDRVCTAEGIAEVCKRLLASECGASGSTCSRNSVRNKRVVIVGGSHSAFSAAWMCLHKLGLTEANGVLGPSSVCILHRSAIRVFYATRKEAEQDSYDNIGQINKLTGQIHPFGGLRGDSKELWRAIKQGREGRVRLLRSPGQSMMNKLYEEAAVIIWACGYNTNTVPILDAEGANISLKTDHGQVDVDERGRLMTDISVPNVTLQGLNGPIRGDYGTVSSASAPNSPLPHRRQPLAVQGSATAGTSSAGFVMANIYGVGLGYGLRATLDNSSEPDGSTGRADGVAVYLKRAATLVLAGLVRDTSLVFGYNEKEGRAIETWEERQEIYGDSKKNKRIAAGEEKGERSGAALYPPIVTSSSAGRASGSMLNSPVRSTSPSRTPVGRPSRFPLIADKRAATGPATVHEVRRKSLDSAVCKSSASYKAEGKPPGRSGSTSLIGSRDAARSAFIAAYSAGNSPLSSMAVYEMSSEYKDKLNRQLDPSQVAKAVSRLSAPRATSTPANGKVGGAPAGSRTGGRQVLIKAPDAKPVLDVRRSNSNNDSEAIVAGS